MIINRSITHLFTGGTGNVNYLFGHLERVNSNHNNLAKLLFSSSTSFQSSDLDISRDESQQRPGPEFKVSGFGQSFSPHMLEIEHLNGQWTRPRIGPLHNLSLHPAAKVLHYAQELFEGMKAYRGVDGKIRLFRPELNMARMQSSAHRLSFPEFDADQLTTCIKELLKVDAEWIPTGDNYPSMYIRPTMIGTQGTLGVAGSNATLLFVLLSPSGSYFATGLKPVSLLADPAYSRAWPGGCGDRKLGSNYGPTIYVSNLAAQKGLSQVLWLHGPDHQLTEVGTMNIFIFSRLKNGERELVTPPLGHSLILPGVTRQSILELTRQWGEFRVTERPINMREISELARDGRLLEIFGTGTACVVCPVDRIHYEGHDLRVPTMEQENPLCIRLLKACTDIQYGEIADHPWAPIVE